MGDGRGGLRATASDRRPSSERCSFAVQAFSLAWPRGCGVRGAGSMVRCLRLPLAASQRMGVRGVYIRMVSILESSIHPFPPLWVLVGSLCRSVMPSRPSTCVSNPWLFSCLCECECIVCVCAYIYDIIYFPSVSLLSSARVASAQGVSACMYRCVWIRVRIFPPFSLFFLLLLLASFPPCFLLCSCRRSLRLVLPAIDGVSSPLVAIPGFCCQPSCPPDFYRLLPRSITGTMFFAACRHWLVVGVMCGGRRGCFSLREWSCPSCRMGVGPDLTGGEPRPCV